MDGRDFRGRAAAPARRVFHRECAPCGSSSIGLAAPFVAHACPRHGNGAKMKACKYQAPAAQPADCMGKV
jgi:hypothetical protein